MWISPYGFPQRTNLETEVYTEVKWKFDLLAFIKQATQYVIFNGVQFSCLFRFNSARNCLIPWNKVLFNYGRLFMIFKRNESVIKCDFFYEVVLFFWAEGRRKLREKEPKNIL